MIKIKLFASFRELIGRSEIDIDILNIENKPQNVKELLLSLDKDYPGISSILERMPLVALNQEFSDINTEVKDGDEIAFIPPMAGGSDLVRIQKENFSVDNEIINVKKSSNSIGGIAIFLGTARDISNDRTINMLEFEHYPEMAFKQLNAIRTEAISKYGLIEASIIHRVGKIGIGENIVLIIAAAKHRKNAFPACQWCIDELKRITPIWKKEYTNSGEIWVEEHP